MFYAACVTLLTTGSVLGMKLTGDSFKDGEEYLKEKDIPKAIECFSKAAAEGKKEAFEIILQLHPLNEHPYAYLLNMLCWMNTFPQDDLENCTNVLEKEGVQLLQMIASNVKQLKKQIQKEAFQSMKKKKISIVSILQIVQNKNLENTQSTNSTTQSISVVSENTLSIFFNKICFKILQDSKEFYSKHYLVLFSEAEEADEKIHKTQGLEQQKKAFFDNKSLSLEERIWNQFENQQKSFEKSISKIDSKLDQCKDWIERLMWEIKWIRDGGFMNKDNHYQDYQKWLIENKALLEDKETLKNLYFK